MPGTWPQLLQTPLAHCHLSPADLRCQYIVDDRGDVDWDTQVGVYVLGHCPLTGRLSVTVRASKETFQVPEEHLEGTNRDGPWWIDRNWNEQEATLTNGTVSLSLFSMVREHAPPATPARRQGALAGHPTPPPLTMPQSVGLRLGKRKVSPTCVETLAVAAAAACRQRSPLRPRRLEHNL